MPDAIKNYAGIVAASIALLILLAWAGNTTSFPPIRSYERTDGVIDLRQFEFDSYRAEIIDEVFYPNALLTPETVSVVRPVDFVEGAAFASYSAVFLVPDDRLYRIAIGFPGESGKIYINGELAGEAPPLGKNEIWLQTYTYNVSPLDGKIELFLVCEGFPDEGAAKAAFTVTDSAVDEAMGTRQLILDSLYIGALLFAFLLLLCIWSFKIKIPQNLIFALACFMVALRKSVLGSQIFYRLFGSTDFNIEYFALCLIPPLIMLYLSYIFPGYLHRFAIIFAFLCSLVYLVFVLVSPYAVYRPWLPAYQVSVAALIVYFIGRLIYKRLTPAFDQGVSLVGIAVLFIAGAHDMLSFNDIDLFVSFPLTEAAMIVFVVTQMAALFIGNARITAEARAAEQLLAEENAILDNLSRMKTDFLQNISHELKTPLTNMYNYALDTLQELKKDELNVPEMEYNQERIRSEGERLKRMVSQLLDVTAIEGGNVKIDKQPISLAELLRRVADSNIGLINENANDISLEIPDGLPEIPADADAVEQVLLNLISNAARHTKQGLITISLSEGDECQELRVSDTGEGIPPDILNQVFLRYIERESKISGRSGMGLYICKKLVDAHGGEMGIENNAEKGASVWFRLPV